PSPIPTPKKFVSALGRLEPVSELIAVSAPVSMEGAVMQEVLVKAGDRVRKGQIIAILDNRDRLMAEYNQAIALVKIKEAQLDLVKSGAKPGEIFAQEAEVGRVKTQTAREIEGEKANLAQTKAQIERQTQAEQANLSRIQAQVTREIEGEQANLSRIEAKVARETEAEQANLKKLQVQLQRDQEVQQANINKLISDLQGEVLAGEATIQRVQSELKNSLAEYQRYESLHEQGAISTSEFETIQLSWQTNLAKLKEAEAITQKSVQGIKEQIKQAEVTLKEIRETGEQEVLQAEANVRRLQETGLQELAEVETNVQRLKETGLQQVQEAEANVQRLQETGLQQLNQIEVNLKRLDETGQQQFDQASGTLAQIVQVRPEDVAVAMAELEEAIAQKQRAEANLNTTIVKAPISGTILKVNIQPGEGVQNNQSVVEMGDTQIMYVVAEIYETDITQIKLGQSATIKTNVLPKNLKGEVVEIGQKIGKKDILETDPLADTDARVVEVRIRLEPESSQQVANLSNLQVEVRVLID
ncbi:MAG: HlyD family efflux transporter periplasmic adaptor subunit, partial [Microcoleaceae cyanobacterium]